MNVDKVVSAAQRQVVSAEAVAAGRMQRYLVEAQRRLRDDLRRGWPGSLPDESRVWREARARALLQQTTPALRALRLGDPENGITGVVRDAIINGRTAEQKQTRAIVRAMTRGRTSELAHMSTLLASVENVIVDFQAVEAQVLNAAARLNKHSVEAIEKINTSVVNGLIRGSGFQPVAAELRTIITGPPGVRGGLAFHAESIARTELLSSLNDARMTRYREAGISQAVWVATGDERVCFPAGTMIATPSGDVPIERVQVGDEVLTRYGPRRVARAHVNEHDGALVTVTAGEQAVTATANHPFWTERGWVRADALERGDTIQLVTHERVQVSSVEHVGFSDAVLVYNLTVEEHPEYFANSILVHNCEYCAARSGNLYALKDLILPSHVRCRCTAVPHSPDWVDEGLVDVGDYESHRVDVEAAFEAAHVNDGVAFNRGATPFEKAAGVSAPSPLRLR